MREWIKWVFISMIGVVGFVAVALLILTLVALFRLNQRYEIGAETLVIPSDAAAIERGKHLVEAVSACTDCHGEQLEGLIFVDNGLIGLIFSSNLTAGEGGIGQAYTDENWVNAIRYGVDPEGKPLLGMPSQHFANYSDEDLAAIIAYLKTLPAVDTPGMESRMMIPGYWLFAAGGFGQLAADEIDHEQNLATAPKPSVSAEYGAYLVGVSDCKRCHGDDLRGKGSSPENPEAPDIDPDGNLSSWRADEFVSFMRNGRYPSGESASSEMPFSAYRQMTEEELEAIWLYLQSLSD
jgi:mono/diheme cytochrome c family protein